MANNFDLRQFLTENKLTKNAQLLKEEINSNVEDIAGAFHEAGLTGMVTVLFQSDSSMGEPDINTMPAERAMKSIISKAANAESVMVAQGSEIRKGEQIGDYEQETEGLECKVVVEILDKGVYEIYQGSNDLEETSRSMKNKMNEAVTLGGKPVDVGSIEIDDIDTADYPDFTDAYITYAEFEDGTPLTEEELMKLEEENYGIVGELIFDRQLYMEGEEGVEDLEEWSPHGSIAFSGNDKPKQREPREGEVELSTLNKGDVFKVADGKADGKDIEFRVWGDNPNGGVYVQYTDYDFPRPNYTMRGTTKVIKLDGEVSEGKGEEVNEAKGYSFTLTYNDAKYVQKVLDDAGVDAVAKAGTFDDEIIVRAFDAMGLRRAKQALEADHFDIDEGVNEAKSYKVSKNSKEAQHLKKGDIIGSGDEVVSVSAGAKTPSGKVEVTLKTKDGKTKTSTWGKTTKIGVKEKETVNEDNLEVKSIAKKLYSWLKQNGVSVSLAASAMGGPNFKKIGIKDPKQQEATIGYWDDPRTKQTILRVSLRGKESIVRDIEKKLLTTYPGLEQFNKQEYKVYSGNLGQGQEIPGFINYTFDLKEKTTSKGGLVGNTQQNPKETVKESTLSPREKYLTRLVENALGLEGYGDDNVNRQREKQGLPPAQGPKYSEGISEEEMVQEKPIPSYKSIEELMKNIEQGTNETAAKYKMEEMKRIAQALEEKVTSLEEGEHAEHIDPKQVKQMKKDVMTLRKQAEKLEKEYDKKFGEKKAKKETKTELREGFDLKKFLVENKLTANSRMLNEADEVDLKLTELGNEKVSQLKKVMVDNGLIVKYQLGGKEFKPKPKTSGDGWDAKTDNVSHNAFIQWNGQPNGVVYLGIGKETNKASDILKFIENTFKEGYVIEKGASAQWWEIRIKPQQS